MLEVPICHGKIQALAHETAIFLPGPKGLPFRCRLLRLRVAPARLGPVPLQRRRGGGGALPRAELLALQQRAGCGAAQL